MLRNALTFAAATCAAALLVHTDVLAYGQDVAHQPSTLHPMGPQIDIEQLEPSLVQTVRLFDGAALSDVPRPLLIANSDEAVPAVHAQAEGAAEASSSMTGGEPPALAGEAADAETASAHDAAEDGEAPPKDRNRLWDPIEGVNRKVLGANDWLDRRVFRHIAKAYGAVTPDFLEHGIRNVFRNLREPATVGNRVLQGEFKQAGKSTARFLLNTTVGVGGFVDFADQVGLEREIADFGQTLYTYGVSAGPYLVLPLMGPTTTRDGFGQLVDRVADPATWFSFGAGTAIAVNSLDGVSLRQEVGDSVDQLRSTSIDWYSTLRSAYYQDRRAFLEGESATEDQAVEDLFDDFDSFDEEEADSPSN